MQVIFQPGAHFIVSTLQKYFYESLLFLFLSVLARYPPQSMSALTRFYYIYLCYDNNLCYASPLKQSSGLLQHNIHATHAYAPHMLERHPHQYATHTSALPIPPTLAIIASHFSNSIKVVCRLQIWKYFVKIKTSLVTALFCSFVKNDIPCTQLISICKKTHYFKSI